MAKNVFVSYARADEAVKDLILLELGHLERSGAIKLWHDHLIDPGHKFRQSIDNAMRNAEIALLLISKSFLDSEFCMHEEAPFLLERNAKGEIGILPVILDECSWKDHPWLEEMQVLPRGAEPLNVLERDKHVKALVDIRETIVSMLSAVKPPASQERVDYARGFSQHLFCEIEEEVFQLAFSRDKKWLAAACAEVVHLWDVSDGKYEKGTAPIRSFAHEDYVYAVAFSPDSRSFITAGQDKVLRKFSLESMDLIWEQDESYGPHEDAVYSALFSPDGRYILSGGYDKMVRIWDAQFGTHVNDCPVYGRVSCIAHAPLDSPPLLAIACHDNSVRVYNRKTGHLTELSGEGHTSSVESVAFSPDGKWLASCGLDKATILWNVESLSSVWRREGGREHTYLIKSIAFSPDSHTIATASWDKKITLRDLEGTPIHSVPSPPTAVPWHKDWIWSVAFSADGKLLASGSSDGFVMVWKQK